MKNGIGLTGKIIRLGRHINISRQHVHLHHHDDHTLRPYGTCLINNVPSFTSILWDDISLRPVLTHMGVRILIACMAF
jgi:hypothetical protein